MLLSDGSSTAPVAATQFTSQGESRLPSAVSAVATRFKAQVQSMFSGTRLLSPGSETQVPWTMTLSSAAPAAVARFGSQVQSMFSAAPAAVIRSEDQSKLRYGYTFPSCSSGSHTVQPQVQSPMLGAVHTGTFPSSDLSISTRHTDDGQRS